MLRAPVVLGLLALAVIAAAAPTGDPGWLVVQKNAISKEAVIGREFVLQYNVFNIGSSTVLDVGINDEEAWPAEQWELVNGTLSTSWEKIAPGGNVSHTIALRAKEAGKHKPTPARVIYRPALKAKEQTGFSSTLPAFDIETVAEFERRTSLFLFEWGVFLVMAGVALAAPGSVYMYCQSSIDKPAKKKRT
eukprot:tig00000865_g5088.t1